MQKYDSSPLTLINSASKSAQTLINLLAAEFPIFRDESYFEDRTVRFLKRAQILVADLWACFDGRGYGEFHDIGEVTMFAGPYRLLRIPHHHLLPREEK